YLYSLGMVVYLGSSPVIAIATSPLPKNDFTVLDFWEFWTHVAITPRA
ncbi:unnamed protein product, partial [marine sediment metagenome]